MRRVLGWIGLVLGVALLGALWWLWTPDRPRAALEARHAAPPSAFVEVEGVRFHLRDTGPRDAPAVLLLHGFGSSLHTWEDWARAMEAERRVVRLDLPGFGLTGADPTGDYSDTRAVLLLAALLDRLGLPRVDLVGSSMGGRIAWRFAAEQAGAGAPAGADGARRVPQHGPGIRPAGAGAAADAGAALYPAAAAAARRARARLCRRRRADAGGGRSATAT
jgi:pimeloyl-ACP methyl ester carboxylesterase